jgi:pyruvate kinase
MQISVVSRQLLKSMCKNPRPTRAEMLDVANAGVIPHNNGVYACEGN